MPRSAGSARAVHGRLAVQGRLDGRRALITDGACELGRDISRAFAREGADLAIGYSDDDADAAEITGALARAEGAQVVLLPGDLSDEGVCGDVVDRAAERLGGLDTLVVIDRVARGNLATLRWLCRAALGHFCRGSAIIATSPLAPSSIMAPSVLERMRHDGIRMRGIAPAIAWSRPDRLPELYVELAAD